MIKRYDPVDYAGMSALLDEHIEGVVVYYHDHLTTVHRLESRIKELEGVSGASYNSGYHRGREYKSQEGPFG